MQPAHPQATIKEAELDDIRQLRMMEWYFDQTQETLWLGSAPRTRAEAFYKKAGGSETGTHGRGEIKFEMRHSDWMKCKTVSDEIKKIQDG